MYQVSYKGNKLLVTIKNYKSIADINFEILPLTILIGPPNGGKSNIMEALSLIGFIGRFIRFIMNKTGNPDYLYEAILKECRVFNSILRTIHSEELFYYGDVTRTINILLKPITLKFSIEYGELSSIAEFTELNKLNISLYGEYRDKFNEFLSNIIQSYIDVCIHNYRRENQTQDIKPFPLSLKVKDVFNEIILTLDKLKYKKIDFRKIGTYFPEVRLYGYERFGVNTKINEVMTHGSRGDNYRYSLIEDASNITSVLNSATYILDKINEWLGSLGTALKVIFDKRKIELLFLKESVSLTPSLASDAVLRMIYYLTALKSAIMVKKIYNVQNSIVMLEEPGAHVFPYSFELLAEAIKEVAIDNNINVIISTHNNLLVSKLWDLFPEDKIATYYVFEKPKRGTIIVPIPISELARKFITSFDILTMKPAELLHELNIDLNSEES